MEKEIKEIVKKLNEGEKQISFKNNDIDAMLVGKDEDVKILTRESADQIYRVFVEKMSQGAIIIHTDGTVLYSNKQFSDFVNVPLENVMGSYFYKYIPDNCLEKFKRLLSISWKKDIRSEIFITNNTGAPIPVLLSFARLQLNDDLILSIVVSDLTKYRAFEKELQIKNRQLNELNDELKNFAYVASHDLQEPLRTVTNYVGLFNKKYSQTLDEKAGTYLKFVTDATARMQMLISDLLEYSRIGRHDAELKEINCNELLQTVLSDMSLTIKESKAEIRSEKLPIIDGYPTEIKSLFQNLLSNAIKFRKKDIGPVINITVQDKDTEWLFAIKDNGIGIDKIYFDRIFIIFKRLHTSVEYPGTGIGLAQVKKIVELHKGRVWIESELDKGSTFYFSISKNLTAAPATNLITPINPDV